MTCAEMDSEVVATLADAAGFTMPPLLVLDRVAAFLDEHGIGEGEIAWRRIGDGQSNITYLIDRGDTRVVLRRGPRPPLPKSTHDMIREATVQQGLGRVGTPAPNILAVCTDPAVLGVPFYVMEYLDGAILLDETPAMFDSPAGRRGASEALVDTLVEIHTVDLERAGLSGFGRPDGYLERQVKTFTGLATQVSQRELPLVAEIGAWLERHRPATQRTALVHGDYRFGNVMFRPEGPPSVLAVLDWEMATLGDPLADLGYLTATYSDPASPRTVMELTSATREPGYLTRDQLAERYASGTGLDISDLRWYQALALWKASVFLEAIYTRWCRGERPGDTFAHTLELAVPEVLEQAQKLTR
ncbi:phosphotransferase family protein [Leucobacter aridicollis]|uniref:phosphotransferase family protein n=1 Tax=Leucobacter aridicollis TaxID=283878 RepID=UPI002103A204|nr:phosphotransferase family protein [Leucobacter aridicollis]UTX52675.1 phosphotransferase family protein [Leucobacter aridicollis]